jgi:hypothetical protein
MQEVLAMFEAKKILLIKSSVNAVPLEKTGEVLSKNRSVLVQFE